VALVLWGPTAAFRQLAWIFMFAALLTPGVTVLRPPDRGRARGIQRGDAMRELRARREAARARKSATGARAAAQVAPTGPAPTAASQSIDDLERLVALHDSGQLSDTGVDSSRARSRCGVSSAELGRPSGGGVHTAPRTPDGTLADAGLRWDDRRAPARRGADARDHDPATSLQRRP
jgi:hypothetical protein